ncbi:MAG: SWIM zinc finger family protein [Asgard group archaeon]|nr:SWIM zinc finger family protein [Asgard group archaeon]
MNSKKTKKHSITPKVFTVFPKALENISTSQLDYEHLADLETLFRERLTKALEAIEKQAVKKYVFKPSGVIRWVVKGKEREYVTIEHNFCSCKDFLFNALYRRNTPACYHLLAREIAEASKRYIEITVDDDQYQALLEKWLL